MKTTILSLAVLTSLTGCAEPADFKADVVAIETPKTQNAEPSADAVPTPEPAPAAEVPTAAAPTQPEVLAKADEPAPSAEAPVESALALLPIKLSLLLPAKEILSGSRTMTVEAFPSRTLDAGDKIVFSLPAGAVGTLVPNADGKTAVYTSPAALPLDTSVLIKAALVSDPKISDAQTLKVSRQENSFVGCLKGSAYYPIQGKVYVPTQATMDALKVLGVGAGNQDGSHLFKLPTQAEVLDPLQFKYVTTICMPNFDLPKRDIAVTGFPGAPTVFENYDIQFSTILNVPKSGKYQFKVAMDDGYQATLNDLPFRENVDIALSEGFNAMKVNYYNGPRRFIIQFYWKKPGDADFSIIPTEFFKPAQ